MQQAALTVTKALFKYSKDSSNDHLFHQEQVLEPLLRLLNQSVSQSGTTPAATPAASATAQKIITRTANDVRIFATGVLKNVSAAGFYAGGTSSRNVEILLRNRCIPTMCGLLNLMDELEASQEKMQFEQVGKVLRRLL